MGWNPQYRYKMMGKPAVCDSEMLYLFKLTDFELFVNGKKSKSYLPEDWRNTLEPRWMSTKIPTRSI